VPSDIVAAAARASWGAWLLRGLAAAVAIGWAAMLSAYCVAHGHSWFLAPDGKPLATDFAAFHIAGVFALTGEAARAYDWGHFTTVVAAFVGSGAPLSLGWLNPPNFFLVVAPLALLPYQASAIAWLGATGVGYLAAARMALGRNEALLFALAAPAVFSCLVKGQSGFLSAALIGFGLMLMDRRPVMAGICIGLLAYKPHLGLMLPVLLAAGGHWRCIGAAAAAVVALAAASAAIFGTAAWLAFIESIRGTADHFLIEGAGRAQMQSVYGFAAPWLGPSGAMLAHAGVAMAALLAAMPLWRGADRTPGPRAAAGIAVVFLTPPYLFEHDAAMLTIAALLLARGFPGQGPRPAEVVAAAFAVLLPGLALFRSVNLAGPVGAVILLVIARRQAARAHPAPGNLR
jgi:hypothetical protein